MSSENFFFANLKPEPLPGGIEWGGAKRRRSELEAAMAAQLTAIAKERVQDLAFRTRMGFTKPPRKKRTRSPKKTFAKFEALLVASRFKRALSLEDRIKHVRELGGMDDYRATKVIGVMRICSVCKDDLCEYSD